MTLRSRNAIAIRRLDIESLEGRRLLAANHAFLTAPGHHSHAARSAIVSSVATLQASTSNSSSTSGTHLAATLTPSNSSTLAGSVNYDTSINNGVTSTSFRISISGGTAGTVLTVTVPDSTGTAFTLGTITLDTNGKGSLSLTSTPTGTQKPLPANMPTLAASTVVSVSSTDATTQATTVLASGTLATRVRHHCGQGGGAETDETQLKASLADTASSLTGKARFESETINGLIVSAFSVKVKGATAGAVIDVSIVDSAGTSVSVGKFTVAANGTGVLSLASHPHGKSQALPANFPAAIAGSSVVLSFVDATTGGLTKITSAALA